jgi:ATP-binding cassette subfamily F protein 3
MLELSGRIAELHERLSHFESLYSDHEAQRILSGLGFSTADSDRPLGEFSGGWRMRAALAALLFQQPDLLLLDEPTNHLDMPSVTWFGHFLRRYGRAFVLICHDRDFLNEQISKVVSFEVEGVRQYKGDYEHYRRQRAEEEEVLTNQARNLAREREKAEQFINRFRAQANKAKAVQSRIKALEKMGEVHSFDSRRIMRFRFPPCERAGNEVLRVEGLHKAFGELRLFSGLNLRVARGEKIGLIGVNGAGKTTLLRMMAGEIGVDAGEIRTGSRVQMGYYAQHHADSLDPTSTVYEEVSRVDGTQSQTRIRNICGAFLFQGDDVDKPVSVLSGGERARVALAKLMLKPGNLLLMDEPTNHLDLESSESLAETLAEYDGSLIFVSHNRSFIRRLATKIWNVEGGRVEEYGGTLDEYMHSIELRAEGGDGDSGAAKSRSRVAQPGGEAGAGGSSGPRTQPAGAQGPGPRNKGSRSEERARKRVEAERRKTRARKLGPLQKEIKKIEAEIEALEAEQKERSSALASPEVYEDQARKSGLLDAYGEAADRLDELTARWEVKSAELEELESEFPE